MANNRHKDHSEVSTYVKYLLFFFNVLFWVSFTRFLCAFCHFRHKISSTNVSTEHIDIVKWRSYVQAEISHEPLGYFKISVVNLTSLNFLRDIFIK